MLNLCYVTVFVLLTFFVNGSVERGQISKKKVYILTKYCEANLAKFAAQRDSNNIIRTDTTRGNENIIPAPENQTAQKIIHRYISTIGGRKKLTEMTDMFEVMGLHRHGYVIKFKFLKKPPDRYIKIAILPSMEKTLFKLIVNGDNVKKIINGNRQDISDQEIKWDKYSASAIFHELAYSDLGYVTKLLGVTKIKTKRAYVIQITTPDGYIFKNYYSVKNGLKLGRKKEGKNAHIVRFSNYKRVQGIMMPFTRRENISGESTAYKI